MSQNELEETVDALTRIQDFARNHLPAFCDDMDQYMILVSAGEKGKYELRIYLKAILFQQPAYHLHMHSNPESINAQELRTPETVGALLAQHNAKMPDPNRLLKRYAAWYLAMNPGSEAELRKLGIQPSSTRHA